MLSCAAQLHVLDTCVHDACSLYLCGLHRLQILKHCTQTLKPHCNDVLQMLPKICQLFDLQAVCKGFLLTGGVVIVKAAHDEQGDDHDYQACQQHIATCAHLQ